MFKNCCEEIAKKISMELTIATNDASKITDIIKLTVSYKLCGDFG